MKVYKPVAPGGVVGFDNTKPVYVIDDLRALHGPTMGAVDLPLYLDWSESNHYDLAKAARLRTLYATVLREAKSEDDLANYLSAEVLRSVWRSLRIPEFIRAAWETRFPELG